VVAQNFEITFATIYCNRLDIFECKNNCCDSSRHSLRQMNHNSYCCPLCLADGFAVVFVAPGISASRRLVCGVWVCRLLLFTMYSHD
jgi:hypothetical protein